MPLDFQGSSNDRRFGRKPPPDYLSRRTQYRIFALVGSLFLILLLMEQARKPENWRWIWTIGGGQVPAEPDVDTRLRAPSDSAAGGAGTTPLLIPADGGESAETKAADIAATKSDPDALTPLRQARHDLWSRLLESLGDENRNAFLTGLKAARDAEPLPPDTQTKWPQIVEQVQAGSQDYVNKAFLAVSQDSGSLTDEEKRSWLEVIEARWLFGISVDAIDVLIHPQSIVHSLVEYADGALIAQLGAPDMRIPIAYALSFPRRLPRAEPLLDLSRVGALGFFKPDAERFPSLKLAYDAARRGGTLPAVMNAANECAVTAFIDGKIGFTDICRVSELVLDRHCVREEPEIGDILAADRWAREEAEQMIKGMRN